MKQFESVDEFVKSLAASFGTKIGAFIAFFPTLLLASWMGFPEAFDLPSPTIKQAIGIALIMALVAS